LAFGIGLGNLETQQKIPVDASNDTCETTTVKNESKGKSSPYRHFIEHLMGVFRKPARKYDRN
jgi:hypothetical protein